MNTPTMAPRPPLSLVWFTINKIILTTDSWGCICRDLLLNSGVAIAPIYFITYIFIQCIIFTNIVVAILLNTFLKHTMANSKDDSGPGLFPPDPPNTLREVPKGIEDLDLLLTNLSPLETDEFDELHELGAFENLATPKYQEIQRKTRQKTHRISLRNIPSTPRELHPFFLADLKDGCERTIQK